MPKINDPVLNNKIRKYVDSNRKDTALLERLNANQQGYGYSSQMSPLDGMQDRRARSVSPIKSGFVSQAYADASPGGNATHSKLKDDLAEARNKLIELDRELRKRDNQVNWCEDRLTQ